MYIVNRNRGKRTTRRETAATTRSPSPCGARCRSPGRVLQNRSVAVRVLKGFAAAVPKGIERRDRQKACFAHSLDGSHPFIGVGDVEDGQVVLAWSSTDRMPVFLRKLEMIRVSVTTEHDAVKSVVILEVRQKLQSEPVAFVYSRAAFPGGAFTALLLPGFRNRPNLHHHGHWPAEPQKAPTLQKTLEPAR